MRIAGSTILITGASSGIGACTARGAARAGARVILVGRDRPRLEKIAEETGGVPVIADLTSPGELEIDAPVDILINNAGAGYAGDLAEMPGDRIPDLIDVNLTAPITLTRALLPGMIARSRGHIAFVTSIAGTTGVRGEAVYSAAKAGTTVFADSLRQELQGTGVGVSTILPGIVDTPFFTTRGTPNTRTTPRPISPERVAAEILRAIEHANPELYVPHWLSLAPRVKGAMPGLYRKLTTRFG